MSTTELKELAARYFETDKISLDLLQGDGSDRRIYRVYPSSDLNNSIIGVWNEDLTENRGFHRITEEMSRSGIPVPELYLESPSERSYLQQDLGKWTLAEKIDHWKSAGQYHRILPAYKKSLQYLKKMQSDLVKPLAQYLSGHLMDRNAYEEDIRYCQKNFFELFGFKDLFTENLEEELEKYLIQPLLELGTDQFVFRDFQSRNIMWRDDRPWFIDYQSAQLGSFYYDLASMLYASRSGLKSGERDELIRYYYDILEVPCSHEEFENNFYKMLLIRRLRSLGSYGYLSNIKKKKYFLKGVLPTLNELKSLFENTDFFTEFKTLPTIICEIEAGWQRRVEPTN